MLATWAMSSWPLTLIEFLQMASATAPAASSIPRFSSMGLAPAATFLRPSLTMAWASTVAVVVPSPAISLVFVAASLSSWAPIFSNGSNNSISLATVTPSWVTVGAPHFLSRATLRPLGPSVVLTAWARLSVPALRRQRASSLKLSCLAMSYMFLIVISPDDYWTMARTSVSFKMRYLLFSILISAPAYLA